MQAYQQGYGQYMSPYMTYVDPRMMMQLPVEMAQQIQYQQQASPAPVLKRIPSGDSAGCEYLIYARYFLYWQSIAVSSDSDVDDINGRRDLQRSNSSLSQTMQNPPSTPTNNITHVPALFVDRSAKVLFSSPPVFGAAMPPMVTIFHLWSEIMISDV